MKLVALRSVWLAVAICFTFSSNSFAKNWEFVDFKTPVPSFKDFNLNIDEVVTLVENKQLLLSHKPTSFAAPVGKKMKRYDNQNFITTMAVFEASEADIRKHIMAFDKYKDFLPHTITSKVLKQEGNRTLSEYRSVFKAPIFKIRMKLVLQHTVEDDGDITVVMRKGGVDTALSRWELMPLSPGRTLVAYTQWTDMSSANFIIRQILKTDPDLKRAAPMGLGAVVLDEFMKRSEGDPSIPDAKGLPGAPTNPYFAKGEVIPVQTLKDLASIGTMLFVHPGQWVVNKEGKVEFIYVSAGTIIEAPVEDVINTSLQFERYDEFFHHVEKNVMYEVNGPRRNNSFDTDWGLKLGVGIMKLDVDYTLGFDWEDKNTLSFHRKKGDITYIQGAWEYIPVGHDKTLLMITSTSKIGKEAPLILKFANRIPNVDMIAGLIGNSLIIEKQKPWIEGQLKNPAPPPSAKAH